MTHKITILHLATESAIWLLGYPNMPKPLIALINNGVTIRPLSLQSVIVVAALCSLVLIGLLARTGASTLRTGHTSERPGSRPYADYPVQHSNADALHALSVFAKDIRGPVITALNHLQDMTKEHNTAAAKAAILHLDGALRILNDASDLTAHTTLPNRAQSTPVDLRHLLLDLHREFAPKAKKKTLSFEFFVDDSLPETVELDQEKLMRVLGILLDLAITSTDQGHVRLSLQTIKSARGIVTLAVSITDTGHGFDRQDQQTLFNPLRQLEAPCGSPRNKFGLAVCQQLLQHIGSELQLDSQLGKGTTISFVLHAAQPDLQQDDNEYPSLQGLTVLYAEDEPLVRTLTMQTLLQQQISVTEVQNGPALLAQAKHQSPDIILLDLQMPGMNGVELIHALKQQEPAITAPIFVLTSHATSRIAEDARRAGADRIFTKPLQILPLANAYHVWQLEHRPSAKKEMRAVKSQNALLNLKSFASVVSSTGANFELRYLPEFQTQLTRDLTLLQNQLTTNHMETAARLAHTCVGLCEIMGANALSKKLRQIEAACRAEDNTHVQQLMQDLPSLLHDTCEQMKTLLQHMPQSRSGSNLDGKRLGHEPSLGDHRENDRHI